MTIQIPIPLMVIWEKNWIQFVSFFLNQTNGNMVNLYAHIESEVYGICTTVQGIYTRCTK